MTSIYGNSPKNNPIYSTPIVHSRSFQKNPIQVVDGKEAPPNMTAHEAILNTLKNHPPFDGQNLENLKVNGKFEIKPKKPSDAPEFGANEAIADEYVSPTGISFFSFNIVWTIKAVDKNKNEIHAIVKQVIYTNVVIPDVKSGTEFEEAKKRAFQLAKSFEMVQRIAISTKHRAHLHDTQNDEVKDFVLNQKVLSFSRSKGEGKDVRYLKLSDTRIFPLKFFNRESKKTDAAGKKILREQIMNSVKVSLRSELLPSSPTAAKPLSANKTSSSSSSSSVAPKTKAQALKALGNAIEKKIADKKKEMDELKIYNEQLKNAAALPIEGSDTKEEQDELEYFNKEILSNKERMSELEKELKTMENSKIANYQDEADELLENWTVVLNQIDALLIALPNTQLQKKIDEKIQLLKAKDPKGKGKDRVTQLQKELEIFDVRTAVPNPKVDWSNFDKAREVYAKFDRLEKKYPDQKSNAKNKVYQEFINTCPPLKQFYELNMKLNEITKQLDSNSHLTTAQKQRFQSAKDNRNRLADKLKIALTV